MTDKQPSCYLDLVGEIANVPSIHKTHTLFLIPSGTNRFAQYT